MCARVRVFVSGGEVGFNYYSLEMNMEDFPSASQHYHSVGCM